MEQNQTTTYLEVTSDERNNKIRLYQETNCDQLATELILEYEPIVKMAASKIARNHPNLYEDLYQTGQISLLRSLQQFDTSIGSQFEPYAMKSMIGHMKNYLRDKSWYVQVPRKIKEKGAQVQSAIDTLTMKFERSPDVSEIAEYLQLSVEETVEVLAGRDYFQVASLDTPLKSEEGSATIGDVIGEDKDDYAALEYLLDLQDALIHLGEQEKQIIQLAYVEGQSQRAIAKVLGISQMSVCRIQKRAVDKLKEHMFENEEISDG